MKEKHIFSTTIRPKIFSGMSLTVFFIFLLVGIAFSGCARQPVASSSNESAAVNKDQTTPNKNAAPPTSNASDEQNKEILWDFRKVSDDKPQEFSKAETGAVLKYLLGETWDKDLEITSRVSGSFTKPNVKETLYFVTGCDDETGKFVSNSTCGHVGWDTAGWIAIYDGTTPVVKIKQSLGGGGIEKVTDVNGDGINEILSSGGYTGMGIVTGGGSIGQISGGKFQEIKSFSGYADDCASTFSKDKKAVAAVVSYTPPSDGKMPDFAEEYFQTKCEGDEIGKNPQWNKITKKQFDEFSKSIS